MSSPTWVWAFGGGPPPPPDRVSDTADALRDGPLTPVDLRTPSEPSYNEGKHGKHADRGDSTAFDESQKGATLARQLYPRRAHQHRPKGRNRVQVSLLCHPFLGSLFLGAKLTDLWLQSRMKCLSPIERGAARRGRGWEVDRVWRSYVSCARRVLYFLIFQQNQRNGIDNGARVLFSQEIPVSCMYKQN